LILERFAKQCAPSDVGEQIVGIVVHEQHGVFLLGGSIPRKSLHDSHQQELRVDVLEGKGLNNVVVSIQPPVVNAHELEPKPFPSSSIMMFVTGWPKPSVTLYEIWQSARAAL
jgi:hypothetical protein